MKRLLFAAAVMWSFASAAHAEILFQGTYQITDIANCPNGPQVGDRDNFQFHPRGVGGNANFAAFTVIYRYGGQEYSLTDGLDFTGVFQVVRNGGLGWTIYTPSESSRAKVTSYTPALGNLTATTPSLTMVGALKNPFGETGAETCVAGFRAVLLRRLDQ